MKPFDVFMVNGHCYLLKLVSNRVFPITEEEMTVLSFLRDHPEEETPDWTTKYGLSDDGRDYDSLREKRWNTIYENRKLSCLELMVAQECNMRCAYCYGDANFGGSGLMTFDIAKKAVDSFLLLAKEKDCGFGPKPSISFMGGEPLLNFPLIRQVMEYVRHDLEREDVYYTITTNATLLTDEVLSFFREYQVGLCISFDGRNQHKYRHFANGKDSYDLVMANIQKALRVFPDAKGRATLYGEGSADEIKEDLRAAGFRNYYINGASGCLPKGVVLNEKEGRYRELILKYPGLTEEFLNSIRDRDQETFIRICADQEFMEAVGIGYHPSTIMMSCGCGRLLYAVDTNGDIYPCHRFVGTTQMRLGNVEEGFSSLNPGEFREHITFHNPACRKCFLRFTCGGSCLHENYCDGSAGLKTPSIHVPFESFCEFRRMAVRLSIHVSSTVTGEDRRWMNQTMQSFQGE